MGKINCNSSKVKFEDQVNSKSLNEYENSVLEEYNFLKKLTEGKDKPNLVDQFFTMTNYKKKFSRLQKWINIAYKELSDEDKQIISERRMLYNNDNLQAIEPNQLEKLNNMLDEMNSVSIDSSIDNFNEQKNSKIHINDSLKLLNLPTLNLSNNYQYNEESSKT